MDDFLYVLKIKLMDGLMPNEVDEQIALYENYINEEIAGGKTLEQVMRKLGDPIKVAEMIIAHKRGEDLEGSPDAEVVDGTCAGCGGGCFRDSGGNAGENGCVSGCERLQTFGDNEGNVAAVNGFAEASGSGQCGREQSDVVGVSGCSEADGLDGQNQKQPGDAKQGFAFGQNKTMSAQEINAQIHNPEHGFHAEFKENEGWDIRFGKLKLNTWYGTFIILGIVLVVFILFSELTH